VAWYQFADLDQIEHSYSITIHKAQRKWIWCSNNVPSKNSTNVTYKKLVIHRNNKSKRTFNSNPEILEQ
jgi:hypothetical protein